MISWITRNFRFIFWAVNFIIMNMSLIAFAIIKYSLPKGTNHALASLNILYVRHFIFWIRVLYFFDHWIFGHNRDISKDTLTNLNILLYKQCFVYIPWLTLCIFKNCLLIILVHMDNIQTFRMCRFYVAYKQWFISQDFVAFFNALNFFLVQNCLLSFSCNLQDHKKTSFGLFIAYIHITFYNQFGNLKQPIRWSLPKITWIIWRFKNLRTAHLYLLIKMPVI